MSSQFWPTAQNAYFARTNGVGEGSTAILTKSLGAFSVLEKQDYVRVDMISVALVVRTVEWT